MNQQFLLVMLTLLCSATAGQSQTTRWVTPTNATASSYTGGGTWYTGPASYAIDGNSVTKWTHNGMAYIDFDLGSTNTIRGIEASWSGSVSSGNTVNIYVDGFRVLTNERFRATSNIRYFPAIRGRVIRYETVALPHNDLGQIATWSEVGEFRAFIETTPPSTPTLAISRAVQVRWPTEIGVIYQVQMSSELITWRDYGAPVTGDGTEKHLFYLSEPDEKALFRVQAR